MKDVPEIYKCTIVYTALICDIILMLECYKKYIKTNDLKYIRYMCTIAKVFSKKIHDLNITELQDLENLSEDCTRLCIDILNEKTQEVSRQLSNIMQRLKTACKALLKEFIKEVEAYLNEV